ncbi:MAG: Ig-like domain-containing protein [Campylobacterota bacterium]|nr:Ig-like domain-containing protein [Campylobacterota bacterium]
MANKKFIYFITIFSIVVTLLVSACSNSKSDKLIQYFSNNLTSSNIPADRTTKVDVFAHYGDGSIQDVTNYLIWSSSDEDLATVDNGLISAKSALGDVKISYKTQEKLSSGLAVYEQTLTFEIKQLSLNSITLSPSSLSITEGDSQTIQAIGNFDDNLQYDITNNCDWHSNDSAIAIVGNSSDTKGAIQGVLEGNTTITATDSSTNINSELNVDVNKLYYTSFSIDASKEHFNVEQTTQLHVIATTDTDQQIILDNTDLTWQSDNETVLSIDSTTAIATAKAKGTAQITVYLNKDISLEDTLTLHVIEDTYMRLFDEDDVEIEFSQAQKYSFNKDSDSTLAKFSIKAVGDDFTISELIATDFNNYPIQNSSVGFVGLSNGDEIKAGDAKTTFELIHDGNYDEIRYRFKIDDRVGSLFTQNYDADD